MDAIPCGDRLVPASGRPARPFQLASLCAILLLAACVSQAEREAAERAQQAADRQECTNLGFTPDTEAFADCLLKQRELRALERSSGGLGVSLGVGVGF